MDTMLDTAEPGIAFAFQQVTQQFSAGAQPVFRDLNLAIGGGRFVTIVGPSGCGKSTLLRLIAGLQTPTSGSVVHLSTTAGRRVGFVFQHPTLLPWRTAAQNLCLPLELGPGNPEKSFTAIDGKSVISLLERVGLAAHDAVKRPSEMSGGMQMRLSLARALATDPTILLLDEPFAAVDDFLRMRLQEDIRRLHEDCKLTTILVTHNIQEAVFLSDQVVVFSGTPARIRESVTIQWQGPRDAEFRDSDEYVKYTRQLNSVLNQQHTGP